MGVRLDPELSRMLYLLRVSQSLPAPSDTKKREELAGIAAKLEGLYGKGKYCGKDDKHQGTTKCRDLEELSELMAKSRKYDELLDAWTGWHLISREMRPLYARLVALGNEGAKEIGYSNLGDLWRSGYDMKAEEFERDTDRLWQQLKPLYDALHCKVLAELVKAYGKDKVPATGPIPGALLANSERQ